MLFFSTSAKTKNQIDILFQYIGDELYEYTKKNRKNQSDDNTIKVKELSKNNVNKKDKKCC